MLCQVSCKTILIILSLIFTVTIAIQLDDYKNSPSLKANSNLGALVNKSVCSNPSAFGFTNRHGTQKYYMIHDLFVTWVEGELLCEKYGAHLPIVLHRDDSLYLEWLVGPLILLHGTNIFPGIWLGGYLSASTSKWKWVNGKEITSYEWGPGEPNNGQGIENCIGILYSLRDNKYLGWNDYAKSTNLITVCELQC